MLSSSGRIRLLQALERARPRPPGNPSMPPLPRHPQICPHPHTSGWGQNFALVMRSPGATLSLSHGHSQPSARTQKPACHQGPVAPKPLKWTLLVGLVNIL